MRLLCATCKRPIEGTVYSNRAVRARNQSVLNFDKVHYEEWWRDEQKRRQQAEMTALALRSMHVGHFNGA